jgi:hypothetical protein
VPLSSLPPLQLSSFDGNPSSSPPPGTTRLSSKRSRPESPGSVDNTHNNKTTLDHTNLASTDYDLEDKGSDVSQHAAEESVDNGDFMHCTDPKDCGL